VWHLYGHWIENGRVVHWRLVDGEHATPMELES
jgi:hypothetical protein